MFWVFWDILTFCPSVNKRIGGGGGDYSMHADLVKIEKVAFTLWENAFIW